MKSLSKVVLASSLVLSAASFTQLDSNHAEAAAKPYYTYNGYAGYDASFFADTNFVKAVHYNNVTFNKVKLDLTAVKKGSSVVKTQSGKNVYDQNFGFYNNKKAAFTMSLPINSKTLSVAAVKKAYKNYPMTYSKFTQEYAYNVNGHMIYFQSAGGKYVSFIIMGNHG